jgi:diadenosine tetraphosphate (Ap4A) HIT family hydrolase
MGYRLPDDTEPDDTECAVCGWIGGPADYLIASNDHAAAIVTGRQRSQGAAVVFPRAHVSSPTQLPGEAMAALWHLVFAVTTAIERVYDPDGMHTWEDIGTLADASFTHLTVDLVPRFTDDTYRYTPYTKLPPTDDQSRRTQAAALAAQIPSLS